MGVNKQKKPSPAERWGNLIEGRLTDKQISDLFDEFGMAKRLQTKEDYDWVRQNLPNIPEEMKKILKMELDKENTARKEAEKARVELSKPVREAPAPQITQEGTGGQGGMPDGQGGAMDPFAEAAKYGYTTQDFANDPGFKAYWVNKTPEQLKQGLMRRSDFDTSTSKKKVAAAPNNSGVGSATGTAGTTGTTGATGTTWKSSPNLRLVKFNADPNGADMGDASTVWIVDDNTKSFRPIMSMQAFQDLYGDDTAAFQAAQNSINNYTTADLLKGGRMDSYIDLGKEYAIYEGGGYKELGFNPAGLKRTYGQPKSDAAFIKGSHVIDAFFTMVERPGSGIDPAFIEQIKNSPLEMARYINALAYGNYTPNDIYKDIKVKEAVSKGDQSMVGVNVINELVDRDAYMATNTGKNASSLPALTPPSMIGDISTELWNSSVVNLPDDYFALADPEKYDPNSQAFKDAVAKIPTAYYDFLQKSLESGLESDKKMADDMWSTYKADLERVTGYKLSDDAIEAWKQLEAIDKNTEEAGIGNTGLENEQIDNALQTARAADKRIREEKLSTLSSEERTQAAANYSPAQIKAMNDEDATKGLPRTEWRAYKWGLVPEVPVTVAGVIADWRAKNPNDKMTDAQIKENYYDNLYDENGNMRSTLYQNFQNNKNKLEHGWDINTMPTQSKEDAQKAEYQRQMAEAEDKLGKTRATAENGLIFGNASDEAEAATRKAAEEDAAKVAANEKLQGTADASPAGVSSLEGTSNGRYKIKNLDEMGTYDASQYSRESDGSVYLKSGIAPETAKKKTVINLTKPSSTVVSKPVNPAPSAPKVPTYATVWKAGDAKTKKKVTVGDPNAFTGGYSLYTGK